MIHPEPVTLEREGVRLEPMTAGHAPELEAAAADGELWKLWYTSVPDPGGAAKYVEVALDGQHAGHMLPWVVRDLASGKVVGSTRYHDIIAAVDRVEIGWTWYSKSSWRTHINTSCKVVGLRTDNFNFRSQRAIEALGAKKDGVIRHHWARRDGTARDSVIYSILVAEWPDVRRHLEGRLARNSK